MTSRSLHGYGREEAAKEAGGLRLVPARRAHDVIHAAAGSWLQQECSGVLFPMHCPHLMNCRPNACLASCTPAAQKGMEKRPNSRPPPATAEMVQNATNEFQAMAKAPVAMESELRGMRWGGEKGGVGWGMHGWCAVRWAGCLRGVFQLRKAWLVRSAVGNASCLLPPHPARAAPEAAGRDVDFEARPALLHLQAAQPGRKRKSPDA